MFKRKASLKAITLVLAASMIFTGLPLSLIQFPASAQGDKAVEEVYIVKELENLRDQYSKTYLKSDGSNVAIISATPLHYKETDKDGKTKAGAKWLDFNYSLETAKDKNKHDVYEAKTGTTTAQLPITADGSLSVSSGKYTLSIKLNDAKTVKSKKTDKTVDKKSNKKLKFAIDAVKENTSADTLTYNNALDDTDINYSMISNGVKENIVLSKTPKKDVKYSYTITVNGLTAVLNKDNSVDFFEDVNAKDKVAVFHLPAAFMTDKSGQESYDIKTSISKTDDGYRLTYAPSMTWLQDTSRAYPVVVDPTVESKVITNISDSYVFSTYTTQTLGYETKVRIGKPSPSETFESYLKLNAFPTDIPEGSNITKATLNLYEKASAGNTPYTFYSGAYEVLSNWSEASLSNSYKPTCDTVVKDWQIHKNTDVLDSMKTWDLTSLVKKWYTNPSTNNGVKLAMMYSQGSPSDYVDFYSNDYRNPVDKRPFFEVDYKVITDFTNCTSKDIAVGRAGDISINDFNGDLTLTRNEIGVTGNVMPVNISMQYSTSNRNTVMIGNGTINAYGLGYRCNYSQKIQYVASSQGKPAYYVYTSENGKKIYFEQKIDSANINIAGATNPEEIFKDVTDGNYTLSLGTNSGFTDYTLVCIKDSSNQRHYFDSLGRLVKIVGNMLKTAQTLCYNASSKDSKASYTYINPDGNTVRFEQAQEPASITDDNRDKIFTNISSTADVLYVGNSITTPGLAYVQDSSGKKYYFNDDGSLLKIISGDSIAQPKINAISAGPEAGVISISYVLTGINANSLAINTITDGSGRVYQFNYDGVPRLISIDYYGTDSTIDKTISYSYPTTPSNDIRVIGVTFPDGLTANYGWVGNLIASVKNTDFKRADFTFDSATLPGVKSVNVYGTDGATVAEDYTIDRTLGQTVYNNADGTHSYVYFDSDGNVTTSASSDGDKGFSSYFKTYETLDETGHAPSRMTSISNIQPSVSNLIKNPGAEDGLNNWTPSVTGYVTTTNQEKFIGENCFKIVDNNDFDNRTDRNLKQTVTLQPSKIYTLSAYIKIDAPSNPNLTPSNVLMYVHRAGYLDNNVQEIQSSNFDSVSNEWQRFFYTFKVTDSNPVDVDLGVFGGYGTIYYDSVQLEQSTSVNRLNLGQNNGFTDANNWNMTQCVSGSGIDPSSSYNESSCLKMIGSPNNLCTAYQDVQISGNEENGEYTFGGWANASNVVPLGDNRTANISLQFFNGDTPLGTPTKVSFTTSGWNYLMAGAKAPGTFTKIRISINYDYQANSICFDDIQLFAEPFGQSINYDANGDVIQNSTTTTETSNASADDTKLDAYGNTLESTNSMENKRTTTFDSYNNQLSTTDSNGRVSIATLKGYTVNGNYLASATDELGYSSTYHYDTETGDLANITDSNGKSEAYQHSLIGQLKHDEKNVKDIENNQSTISVDYGYDSSDRLSTITHNGFNYSFGYDPFGQLTTVNRGTQNLITNEYNSAAQGSSLKKVTYGNGQVINYTYNAFNQLSDVTGGQDVTYDYDLQGNVNKIYDIWNNLFTVITTDPSGKTKTSEQTVYDYGSPRDFYGHDYWLDNNVFTEFLRDASNSDGVTRTTNFTSDKYGNNTGTWWTLNKSGVNVDTRNELYYDDLGRKTSSVLYTKQGNTTQNLLNVSYAYSDVPQFKTSHQIYAMNMRGQNYNKSLSYEYDAVSNITKAGDVSYQYDEAGQLVRVNDPAYGTTVYCYDVGGNIKYVKSYSYTTGELGSNPSVKSYEYDQTWGDELSKYDGQDLSYDAIGNPLTYRDGMSFTWTKGRMLKHASVNGTSIDYTYRYDGNRFDKIVNGVQTNYTVVDGRITAQTDGTNGLYFRYDSENSLIGFELNGTDYYYVKNLQGDIIGILNNQGKCVVEYTYDAWGKLLHTTDTSELNVGVINPFRYRGYYYDVETGLYYLQSRYYDPTTGRFLNADDTSVLESSKGELLGSNLFAYCNNSPLIHIDPDGKANKTVAAFTINEFGSETCSIARESCAKVSMKKDEKILNVQTTDEFVKKWNSIPDVTDFVIINAHGNPHGIGGAPHLDIKISDVEKRLNPKKIGTLVLLGCNNGHYTHRDCGIMKAFFNKISGQVVASDGTVYAQSHIFKYDGHYTYESKVDDAWYEGRYYDNQHRFYDNRKSNYGWMFRRHEKNNPLYWGGISKKITMSMLIDYLKGNKWM